jgi:hypothetical protein
MRYISWHALEFVTFYKSEEGLRGNLGNNQFPYLGLSKSVTDVGD